MDISHLTDIHVMFFKKKGNSIAHPKTKNALPTTPQNSPEDLLKYTQAVFNGIISESGDGFHFLSVRSAGLEDIVLAYGRTGANVHCVTPLNDFYLFASMRLTVSEKCDVVLESARITNPLELAGKQDDEIPSPDDVYGWSIESFAVQPLSAKQLIRLLYRDTNKEARKRAEQASKHFPEHVDALAYPEITATRDGNVHYRDGWRLS